MKQLLLLASILLVSICPETKGQGIYPLHSGNVWQYYNLPYSYGWTEHVEGDTTMQNGLTYKTIARDFGETEYLRQVGSRVYEYRRKSITLFEDHILYDFSKTVGDTIFIEYEQDDTLLCTIIQDNYVEVFGRLRRQQLYYERTKRWIFHILREVTDSIGLTQIESEASPSYKLTGAIINRQQFGTITGVDVRIPTQPNQFTLLPNYPNPFNPTTNIRFELEQDGPVYLKIYNLLGQEVATPLYEERLAGNHEVWFDGSDLASGAYIYKLTSGKSTASKIFLLMK